MAFNKSSLLALTLLAIASSTKADKDSFVSGRWGLKQEGVTGVSAMMLMVASEDKVVVLDKVQHNALQIDGHVAWGTEFDLNTKEFRTMRPKSNTWCATGSFLGNGTIVSSAGNAFQITGDSGLQGVRMYTPSNDSSSDWYEDQDVHRLTSPRWYPSSVRTDEGSVMVVGGSTDLTYFSTDTLNNPTYEFFPPKNIHGQNGTAIPMKILKDSQGANQYPNVHVLPDGDIFLSVNNLTTLFNWRTNTETRLPTLPNGIRISSPFSGSTVLLPLTPENNYTPEVLICGGVPFPDSLPLASYDALAPVSDLCFRMALTRAGIRKGWQVERMPFPWHMLNMILLPDGRVLLVNGGQTGMAGFNSAQNRSGESNAMVPNFKAVIYNPLERSGRRFSSEGVPASAIARMYHSTATLIPNGEIMLAGSSPNVDVSQLPPFPTEYRAEFLAPPYTREERPTYTGLPGIIPFGSEFSLRVNLPRGTNDVSVSLMDFGFSTHGVQMDQRLLKLRTRLSKDKRTLFVTAPQNGGLYPAGPAFLFVVTDKGVPSVAAKTIIGTGQSPPVDEAARANLLLSTRRLR